MYKFLSLFGIVFFILIIFSCSAKNKDLDLNKMFGKISEVEDNDSTAKFNEVMVGSPILGYLEKKKSGKDVDFYKIKPVNGDLSYEIIVSPVPEVDLKLTLLDEKQKVVVVLDENGIGEGEKLWEFSLYGDFVFLKVESKTGSNEKSPYIINFIKKEINYSEIEPNNSANEAIIIKNNDTKSAFISPRNDVDYYKLIFDNDKIYDFYVEIETLSNLDINFILIEKNTNIVKTINSEGFGGTEISPYLSSNKGEYFIKVSGKINTSDKKPPIYYITVKEQKSTIDENEFLYEREINDISQFSTELISNIEILGNIYPEGDVDWFNFSLYKKPISVDISISESRGVDFITEIFDSNMKLIKTINRGSKDEGEHISINDIEAGKFFVKVYGNGNSRLLYKTYLYVRY